MPNKKDLQQQPESDQPATDQPAEQPSKTTTSDVDALPAGSFARETGQQLLEFAPTEQDEILTGLINDVAKARGLSRRQLLNRL